MTQPVALGRGENPDIDLTGLRAPTGSIFGNGSTEPYFVLRSVKAHERVDD
jgi:hypothetical protein